MSTISLCTVHRCQTATSTCLDYEFVTPSDEFYCPVTKEVLLDPHQTRCCGNLLSAPAVSRIQKACPICKRAPFKTYPDQNAGRRVRGQKVFCLNKNRGCQWVGELSAFDSHEKTCLRKDSPIQANITKSPQTQYVDSCFVKMNVYTNAIHKHIMHTYTFKVHSHEYT